MSLLVAGPLVAFALAASAAASTAYGTLNNFDCVNDTGVEAHGFEIELDDIRSTDITYTYDYNHYGVPKITEDLTDPAHPKVFVRYAATWNASTGWSAYTAVPSGPISPTDGHQFTNPSVNFGGEHFGVGYFGTPTAVKYHWLIEGSAGVLVAGPPVYVATPTFTYQAPAPAQPAQVVPAIVLPPPPQPPVLQFGAATWVMDIKTTTHNANKVELTDLVDPDPDNPAAPNWTNGEPAEVESEWRLLQTEFANPNNPKGVLEGLPEEMPGGDEIITRRYEFYKYIGPIDAESGEAVASAVAADGLHGVGEVTYNDHINPDTGEWVTATVDLSTIEVVGDFIGAQMSGFDLAPALGLIDHIPDGTVGVAYADRTVVIPGPSPYLASVVGPLPTGTTFDEVTGVFSGTPTAAGVYTFTITADVLGGASVSRTYTVTIALGGAAPPLRTIATSASPLVGGTTAGDGEYADGTQITVVATHAAGYAFENWTEDGTIVSESAVYPFTVNGARNLVANFVVTYAVTTSASPAPAGTTAGDGLYKDHHSVTVTATANPGYVFYRWMEGTAVVSSSASYAFLSTADRALVAEFLPDHPVLSIDSAVATRVGSKVEIATVLRNAGGVTASGVTIVGKKDATLDGKGMNDHAPVLVPDLTLGGGTASITVTYAGVKPGTRTLQLTVTYTGGTAVVSAQVTIP